MNRYRFIILAALFAWFGPDGTRAQTKVPAQQLRTSAAVTVLVCAPSGCSLVPLGPGLAIVGGVLTVQPLALTLQVDQFSLSCPAPATCPRVFTATQNATQWLAVVRNGLVQADGFDYKRAGGVVTFTSDPQDQDIVLLLYWVAQTPASTGGIASRP